MSRLCIALTTDHNYTQHFELTQLPLEYLFIIKYRILFCIILCPYRNLFRNLFKQYDDHNDEQYDGSAVFAMPQDGILFFVRHVLVRMKQIRRLFQVATAGSD